MLQFPEQTVLSIKSLLGAQYLEFSTDSDLEIHESHWFKSNQKTVQLDNINANFEQEFSLNFQWLSFAGVNVIAAIIFYIIAKAEASWSLQVFTSIFSLISLFAVYQAYKYKNPNYTLRDKYTGKKLIKLLSNEFNQFQVNHFITELGLAIQTRNTAKQLDHEKGDLQKNHSERCTQYIDYLYNTDILDIEQYDQLYHRLAQQGNGTETYSNTPYKTGHIQSTYKRKSINASYRKIRDGSKNNANEQSNIIYLAERQANK